MMSAWLDSWNALYANHAALRTAIEFAHIGGLVAGGGSFLPPAGAKLRDERGAGGRVRVRSGW